MPAHLSASLLRISLAMILQIGIGLGLGVALGMSRKIDKILGPVVYLLFPLPKIAFLPIFMIMFGLGELSKILFVTTVLMFQTSVSLRDGVREIPKELFLAARSLGMDRRSRYRHLVLPAILPRLLSSLRLGLGTGLAVLFFAENYATRFGIGYFIMNSFAMADYKAVFSGILALGIVALGLFSLVDMAEARLCRWTRSGKGPL